MCYARATQQTSDAEPTLAQRWFTVYEAGPTPHQNRFNVSCPAGTTYENIESRSPGKNQTTTQSGFTAGPSFRTPAQQQNNIGPLPASPGQCRHQQAKTLSQSRPKSWTSATMTQHRAGTGPEPPQQNTNTSSQCRYNVVPSSSTLAQHCNNTGRTPRGCRVMLTWGLKMLLHAEGEVKNSQPKY